MNFDEFLREACPPLNLEWRKYRRRAARHRVQERLRELRLSDFSSYLEILRNDATEAGGLADLMRITVSRFFRDAPCWIQLYSDIVPRILTAKKSGDRTFHVWSAGCCGGEEPYSMALAWLEYLQPVFPGARIEIVATDIDGSSLERAFRALYGPESLRDIPTGFRDRWFSLEKGMWRLHEQVKGMVRFQQSNLFADDLPCKVDLLMCRYLIFTYFRGERRLEAAKLLWKTLQPWGVLMIGRKERLVNAEYQLYEELPGGGCFFGRKAP